MAISIGNLVRIYVPLTISNNASVRPLGIGLKDNIEQESEDKNALDWERKVIRILDASR